MTEQLKTEVEQPNSRARLLDLSLTQLTAGSLAAATAAALGSRLGVVGTIAGAAIGSVISAVAASLYATSMSRAREALRWQKMHARPKRSMADSLSAIDTSNVQSPAVTPTSSVQFPPARAPRRVLGTAAVAFAVAIAFLVGLQLASGADVTGTSIGTRPPAARSDMPGAGVDADSAKATPTPSTTATGTAPSTTPQTTGPAEQPTTAPTDPAQVPDPAGSTPPADPGSGAPPTPGAGATDATPPPTQASPTTPAS